MNKKHLFITTVLFFTFLLAPLVFATEDEDIGVRELSLIESMELAVTNSSTLQIEAKKQKAANLNNKNVELSWVPDLLIGASYKYEEAGENEYGEILPFLTLSQVVFNNQESYTKKLEAMNRIISVQAAQIETLSELLGNTIQKYFSLIQTQTSVELMENYLEQIEKDFSKLKSKANKGLISQLEFMQSESMLEFVKIETAIERDKVGVSSFDLASHLNLDVDQELKAIDFIFPLLYTLDYDSCKEFARAHHPILKLNNRIVAKIPEFRRYIKLINWPSVSVSAYLGTGANEWDNESKYSASITLSKPLWDFGKTKRRQEVLSIELDTTEDTIKKSEKEFFLHLKKLYADVQNSGKLLRKLTAFQKLAEKLNSSTEKNYKMGRISYEELLQGKKKDIGRKIEYQAVSSRYFAALILLKLNCGVFDSELLLQKGPGWLEMARDTTSQETSQ